MYELQSHRAFSCLDEMLPPLYYSYLLSFPMPNDANIEQVRILLQESLSALGLEYSYLNGDVRRDNSGQGFRLGHLVLDVPEPSQDMKAVFNDLTQPASGFNFTYQDLKAAGMPLQNLDSYILAPLTAGIGQTTKVFSLQANFIEGGLLLAFCFHHNFVDAYGAARIVSRYSEHCDGSAMISQSPSESSSDDTPEILNVERIKASCDPESLKEDPNLWQLNCLDWREPPKGHVPYEWPIVLPSLMPPQDPPINSFMFSFTSQALADLKKLAKTKDSNAWISTNDALVAFLWRHIMRARFPWSAQKAAEYSGDGTSHSTIVVALNGRKELSIPPSYIGNVLFHCHTKLPVAYIGGKDTPLGDIALSIRETVNKARDRDILTKVVALAATLPDVRAIRHANDNLGKDLYTTSWFDLPFYTLKWGLLGKTDFFRIPDKQFYSLACILPPRQGGEIIDVILSLEETHGDRLKSDEEFARFATYVAPLEKK